MNITEDVSNISLHPLKVQQPWGTSDLHSGTCGSTAGSPLFVPILSPPYPREFSPGDHCENFHWWTYSTETDDGQRAKFATKATSNFPQLSTLSTSSLSASSSSASSSSSTFYWPDPPLSTSIDNPNPHPPWARAAPSSPALISSCLRQPSANNHLYHRHQLLDNYNYRDEILSGWEVNAHACHGFLGNLKVVNGRDEQNHRKEEQRCKDEQKQRYQELLQHQQPHTCHKQPQSYLQQPQDRLLCGPCETLHSHSPEIHNTVYLGDGLCICSPAQTWSLPLKPLALAAASPMSTTVVDPSPVAMNSPGFMHLDWKFQSVMRKQQNNQHKDAFPREVIVISDDSDSEVETVEHYSPLKTKKRSHSSSESGLENSDVSIVGTSSVTTVSEDGIPIGTFEETSLITPTQQKLSSTATTEPQPKKKRRRVSRNVKNVKNDMTFEEEIYVPPRKPIVKAADVHVKPVYDATRTLEPCDDNEGHYIVRVNTDLTPRYHITKILGQGTFGKVVAAYDRIKKSHCAIKIIRAIPKYRDASRIELRVLSTLSMYDKHNVNKCIQLKECFDYRNHVCIVTDLLGISVFDFMKANQFLPFPAAHVQNLARQLLKSVAFLHDLNLIHTDLKPENILLVDSASTPYPYRKGKQMKTRNILKDTSIRLIDFGSAIFSDEYHSSVVSTRHYRAPEIILGTGWSFPCDMWSIGCILVEFCTGEALFQTHDNLEHLALMQRVIGKEFTKSMIRLASRNSTGALYVNPRLGCINYPDEGVKKSSEKYVYSVKTFDQSVRRVVSPNGENRVFWDSFMDLLFKIFVYDPEQRITAKEALDHPWFKMTVDDNHFSS